MRALGVKYARIDHRYGDLAAQNLHDQVMNAAIANGIEPTMILGGWLSYPNRPSLAVWEEYARTTAIKYTGKVRIYEVINEPDVVCWSPQTYVPYLQAAYRGIKAGNPDAIVATGGHSKWDRLACGVSQPYRGCGCGTGVKEWVRAMYAAGAKGYFDILGVHLYDDAYERGNWNGWDHTFVTPDNTRAIMDAQGDTNKPIWNTESGARPTANYPEGVLNGQKRVAFNNANAVKTQRFPIANVAWYTLHDYDEPGFGLLDRNDARRPAWFGFRDGIASQ